MRLGTKLGAAVVVIVFLVGALGAAPARAQGFDGQRYQPSIGAAGGFQVERAYVPRHLGFSFGLMGNYAHDPVVVRSAGLGEISGRPLHQALTLDLLASIGLFNFLELGADLPLSPYYTGDTSSFAGGRGRAGVGDLRLMPKIAKTLRGSPGIALGLAVPVTLPTGSPADLRGNGALTVQPEVLFALRAARFGLHANAGFRFRAGGPAAALLGNEFTYGLGAQIALLRRDLLDLQIEGVGSYYFGNLNGLSHLPIEVLAGLAIKPHPDWTIEVGGGMGLTRGVGDPLFRLVLGVRYSPTPTSEYSDADNDGVPDYADACPHKAEDQDGFQDDDGCPEGDNDRDGVPDDRDECPDEPEGKIGDGDGCPEPDVRFEHGRIVVKGKVQFETGSTELKPKSQRLLDRVAMLMKANPEIRRVRVEGHTDEVGPAMSNQELSERRATVVEKELVKRGISSGRLAKKGYGETRPVAPNKTAAGRAKNRRVEFILID